MSNLRRATHDGLPLAVILLAWGLRLQNLTYHSLWFDEAMSVHWARSDIARILEVTMNLVEDRLPPLYYLLLHGWRLLAGEGEVALRLPSVVLGVLLVAVVFRLADRLFGCRVATLTVVLTALNPFLIWYSQEARMYALAALLGASATWCFVAAVSGTLSRRAPAHWWFAYGICVVAGLYTHFYTAMLVPAHALYLLWTWRRSHRAWLPFALVLALAVGLFVPLALAAARASGEAGAGQPLGGVGERMWALLIAFTVWKAPLTSGAAAVVAAVMGLLALIALVLRGRTTSSGRVECSRSLLVLLLVMPPFIATLLLARNRLAFFGERYFIVMVPWLLLAIALGAARLADLARRLPGVLRHAGMSLCWVLPVVLTLIPLPGQWSPPARKEAWRETVAYLAAHARAEDAILIHPDWTRYPLQYYFVGPGQTYAVFSSVDAATDLDSPLTTISSRHPVVWLVESHSEQADPEHRVNAWLAARYPLVTELYPPGLAVHAYAPGYRTDRLPDSATPASATFRAGLRLSGYVLAEPHVSATDDLFHPPSGWVKVVTYWKTDAILPQNFTAFAHVVDGMGQVWGASLERGNDAFRVYPTSRWSPGEVVRADFDVNLNPVTPPGAYTLVIGLRDSEGAQVALADGTPQATLSTVEIVD